MIEGEYVVVGERRIDVGVGAIADLDRAFIAVIDIVMGIEVVVPLPWVDAFGAWIHASIALHDVFWTVLNCGTLALVSVALPDKPMRMASAARS